MQNSTSKKADPIEILLIGIFKSIFSIFKSAYYGMKRINNVKALLGLLLFSCAAAGAYTQRELIFSIDVPVYVHWVIYCALLASPLLYLCAGGYVQIAFIKYYNKIFEDFNFIGKNKKYPQLIYKRKNDKKTIFAFKSNIPLDTWFKSKTDIETNFDCNVTKIEQLGSKKKVELTTISSAYKIPTNIPWNDSFMLREKKPDGSEVLVKAVLVAGENALGKVLVQLNKSPHVLIAGETNGGKSVMLRLLLWQFINQGGIPFMLDFKGGVEFGLDYEAYGEVITEREAAIDLLDALVEENKIRMGKFRLARAKNLDAYNKKTGENLSRIGLFCDEIGEMLDKQGASDEEKQFIQQINGKLSKLARLSRATGINLFMGTQRPDCHVLTGQIKNNLTTRLCTRLGDKPASEIVIGNSAAYYLPDIKGRFLYRSGADTEEYQAYYFDDDTMLHAIETADNVVMFPGLEKRLVSSKAAAAPELPEPEPEQPQAPATRKPSPKSTTGEDIVELDFNYGKAVNK